jgi:pyruvate/2-oxoglutarate dehydrogenase complex dihydrolipoamide acyltransferase (E2) component
MAVEIQMPQMGESVTEGTVLEWHVSEGEEVEEGQTVVEVSTDKVDAEVPAPESGTITKLLVDVDDEVKVGAALAELEPGPNGASAEGASPGAEADPSAAEAERAAAEGGDGGAAASGVSTRTEGDSPATSEDSSVSAGETTEEGALQVVMPEMGESVTEGTVLEWRVSEGDEISEGDTIVEVSTDKVDAEVPAPASGTVSKLLVEVDDEVKVGAPLAEITPGEVTAAAPSGDATAEAETDGGGTATKTEAFAGKATPVARRIAAERGVDLAGVNGSGSGGKVTKEDVLAAADGKPSAAPARARRSRCGVPPRCSPRRWRRAGRSRRRPPSAPCRWTSSTPSGGR